MADNKPMPLRDLPDYIRSVREHGQGDDVPVVEMGRIVSPNRFRPFLIAVAACLFLVLGGTYILSSTNEIEISSGAGAEKVAAIISDGGGRILSVERAGDDKYRVRVFTFGRIGSFLERLKENEEFESVRLGP